MIISDDEILEIVKKEFYSRGVRIVNHPMIHIPVLTEETGCDYSKAKHYEVLSPQDFLQKYCLQIFKKASHNDNSRKGSNTITDQS